MRFEVTEEEFRLVNRALGVAAETYRCNGNLGAWSEYMDVQDKLIDQRLALLEEDE